MSIGDEFALKLFRWWLTPYFFQTEFPSCISVVTLSRSRSSAELKQLIVSASSCEDALTFNSMKLVFWHTKLS
jgi:hypothetical protein